MGERKVLNKYFPPDFDPKKIPKRKQPKNYQRTVRMMLPMSIRCATCGNYIYKGTKFNSRKEEVIGETYLGIKILRFYFKCTKCCEEITFKTDWKNSDYTVEYGATRNFEPWRGEDEEIEKEKRKRDAADSMKSLENRTLVSKRRMDIDAGLDELKSLKAIKATVSLDAMLEANLQRRFDDQKRDELEDETLVRSVVFERSRDPIIKRIRDEELEEDDNDDDDDDDLVFENKSVKRRKFLSEKIPTNISDRSKAAAAASSDISKFIFKSSSVKLSLVKKQEAEKHTCNGLQSLCQQYDSDEDIYDSIN